MVKTHCMISFTFNILIHKIWYILMNAPFALENYAFLLLLSQGFSKRQLGHINWQCHSGLLYPYCLCLPVLPISDRGVMIFPTVNMNLCVSSCSPLSFWFRYFETQLLGEYTFRIVTISWKIGVFIIIQIPFFNTPHFKVYIVK